MTKDCFWANQQNGEKLHVGTNDIFEGLSESFSLPSKNVRKDSIGKPLITLRVIDQHVAQNLLISLRGLFKKLSHDQIKRQILCCDTSILDTNYIEALIKFLPQHSDMKKLHEMKKNGLKLSDIENFVADLGDIERLLPRLQCLNFKLGFEEMIRNLKPNIMIGIYACEEVLSSDKFARILKLILSIGNFLNHGSSSKGALGFSLSSLAKLNETKSTNNKRTLMDFVVSKINEKFPQLLDFSNELKHTDEAAFLNTVKLDETVKNVVGLCEKVGEELKKCEEDHFKTVMTPFARDSQGHVEDLKKYLDRLKEIYINVGKHFSFDEKEYPVEECFRDILAFKLAFRKSLAETSKASGAQTPAKKNEHRDRLKKKTVKARRAQRPAKKADHPSNIDECRVSLKRLSEKGMK